MACKFCGRSRLSSAFHRKGRQFLRCGDCGGFQQPIDQIALNIGGKDSFDDGGFLRDIERAKGASPDMLAFRAIKDRLPTGRLLELGPGAGHFLAAAREAGYHVDCVEINPTIREYLLTHWDIAAHDSPLEENLLPENVFDCVVSFNCIEHILEPVEHMKAVRRVLRPGGIFLFSTCNADCVVQKLFGGFLSMFKPPDHVSIGSAASFSRAAERAGLLVRRIDYCEYPFETPIGLAAAARDFVQEKILPRADAMPIPATSVPAVRTESWAKSLLRRSLRLMNAFDERLSPAVLTKLLGISGAIRVELQRPE